MSSTMICQAEAKNRLLVMAIELNNVAVQLHYSDQLDDAYSLYKDALQAMRDSAKLNESDNRSTRDAQFTNHNNLEGREQQSPGSNTHTTDGASSAGLDQHEENCTTPSISTGSADATLARPTPIVIDEQDCEEDDESLAAILLHNMGLLNCQRGSIDLAVVLLKMASSLMSYAGSRGRVINIEAWISVNFMLGVISSRRGQHEESLEWFLSSVRIGTSRGGNEKCASLLNRIARVLFSHGRVEEALQAFHGASMIYRHSPMHKASEDTKMIVDDEAAAPAA